MTRVEKSEISFNICTNYGILLHFTRFCFCDLRSFVAKSVCCDLRDIVWRKFEQKIVPVEKNYKYQVCFGAQLRPLHYFLIGNRLRFHSFVLTKDYFKFGTFLIFGTGFETWDIF